MAQFEQLALARQRLLHLGLIQAAGELGRHRHAVGAVAFGSKPRLACVEFDQTFIDDRQIRAGNRFVQPDEHIAGFDVIAVAHE